VHPTLIRRKPLANGGTACRATLSLNLPTRVIWLLYQSSTYKALSASLQGKGGSYTAPLTAAKVALSLLCSASTVNAEAAPNAIFRGSRGIKCGAHAVIVKDPSSRNMQMMTPAMGHFSARILPM